MGETAKKYAKEALIKSAAFARYRDLLEVILSDDRKYSVAEAEKLLGSTLKRKVS